MESEDHARRDLALVGEQRRTMKAGEFSDYYDGLLRGIEIGLLSVIGGEYGESIETFLEFTPKDVRSQK